MTPPTDPLQPPTPRAWGSLVFVAVGFAMLALLASCGSDDESAHSPDNSG